MNDTNVILEVKNLKKTFGDHVVLKDINTTITKGEVIAIIGPSGCGKSTFLKSLNRMIDLVDAVGGIEVTNHFDFPISIAENDPEFQAIV